MKVLILGCGAVGSVIARLLNKEKSVSKITCGDKNIKSAKKFLHGVGKKVSLVKIDVTNEKQLISVAKGVDLIINATLPHFNQLIMDVALTVRANYQDLCSHLDKSSYPTQLKYCKRFKEANLVALINTGLGPGLTNILAKNASERFDSIESIKIRTLLDPNAVEPIFAMSPEIMLEESLSPSLIYKNKKFKYVKQFSNPEYYEFPEPIGKRFVFSVYGDEIATLPRSISAKNMDFKSGGVDIEASKSLFDLGLLSKKPIKIGKASFIPLEFFSNKLPSVPTPKEMITLLDRGTVQDAFVVTVVELDGSRCGKKLVIKSSIVFPSLKEMAKILPGVTYISYPTGLAACSFSKIIPLIKERGVILPENLPSLVRQMVILELISNGIEISEKISN